MLKVTVDDEEIQNVRGWYISGNVLVLRLADGSERGLTGFVDFIVERIKEE